MSWNNDLFSILRKREQRDSANRQERKASLTRKSDEEDESDNDNFNKESLAKR